MRDIPLHADPHFDPPSLIGRWFYLLLGFAMGLGVCALAFLAAAR